MYGQHVFAAFFTKTTKFPGSLKLASFFREHSPLEESNTVRQSPNNRIFFGQIQSGDQPYCDHFPNS